MSPDSGRCGLALEWCTVMVHSSWLRLAAAPFHGLRRRTPMTQHGSVSFAAPHDVRQPTGASRARWPGRFANLAFTLAALLGAASAVAQAQQGTVSGAIIVEGAQRPLPGAQITVQGQAGKEATSDASGRFRITGVTGTTVALDVRALG